MDRLPMTRVKPTTSRSFKTKAINARTIKNMLSTLTRSHVLKQKITKADQHHSPLHTFTAITIHDYDSTATSPQKSVALDYVDSSFHRLLRFATRDTTADLRLICENGEG